MFTVDSQIRFMREIREITKGKTSHILFLKDVPKICIEVFVKKGLFKHLELSDNRNQYYITERFLELTNHLI